MKILNKTDFLKMPRGTFFSYFKDGVFTPLQLKGDTQPDNTFHLRPLDEGIEKILPEKYVWAKCLAHIKNMTDKNTLLRSCVNNYDNTCPPTNKIAVWDATDIITFIETAMLSE